MTPEMLSLSNSPGLFVGVMLVKLVVVFGVTMLIVAYATWSERKVIGHMQTRLGPMRTGWHGLLQPIADGIKLFFKEDIIPSESTKVPFLLAPMMILVPALITVAVIPFGPDISMGGFLIPQQITDLNIGVLYILAFAGLGIYGIVLAGWASNSKYALLGSIRGAAQMISYELALGLSIIPVVMMAGSFSLVDIVNAQTGRPFIFLQPIAFIIFIISALAESKRTPFDLPEADTEVGPGFHTEYSGMRFGLFFLGEYVHMQVLGALIAVFFLGGWHGPFLPPIVWLFIKIIITSMVMIWIRATLPRFRYDQLMNIGWRILLPAGLINILITGLFLI